MQCINYCGFLRHPKIKNNGGNYCCRSCKLSNTHGKACWKQTPNLFNTDIVISINVYKSLPFLNDQLKNISDHLQSEYVVILNCNELMLDTLKQITLAPNVYLNPEPINKKRFHGSLTQGIVSNMQYAITNFAFKYFVILSARTVFYRNLVTSNLDEINAYLPESTIEKKCDHTLSKIQSDRVAKTELLKWHWPSFKNTLLAKYYLNKGFKLHATPHEGLCFNRNVINTIVKFLMDNNEIKEELFTWDCAVEEFALHTIAMNEIKNKEYGYIYIGNGCFENVDLDLKDRYLKKIPFS